MINFKIKDDESIDESIVEMLVHVADIDTVLNDASGNVFMFLKGNPTKITLDHTLPEVKELIKYN